jgi:hypothetical protein
MPEVRWRYAAFAALASIALGARASAAEMAPATAEQCGVLMSAAVSIALHLNHSQGFRVHDTAFDAPRIVGDHILPSGFETGQLVALSLSACVQVSGAMEWVPTPRPPSPMQSGKNCLIKDGLWLSAPSFDAGRRKAKVVVVENQCGTDGWLVEMEKTGNAWVAKGSRNLWFSQFEMRSSH